jgi:hypothetical protein
MLNDLSLEKLKTWIGNMGLERGLLFHAMDHKYFFLTFLNNMLKAHHILTLYLKGLISRKGKFLLIAFVLLRGHP